MRLFPALALPALALAAAPAAAFELTILHVNDFHSRIEPINRYDSTCSAEDDAAGECFGGVARLKTLIHDRRAALEAAGASVLTLDAGDQFQGSLFYTTYKGRAAVEFMNAIGFDAMAVGNHEFDDGPDALAAFVEAASFPVLSANTVAAEGSALDGKLPAAMVFERGGETVGVFSVVAEDTAETSSPGPDVAFEAVVETARRAVAALEAEGVTRIVALTHIGLVDDIALAEAVPGIDAIVGGHSHTLLSNTQERAAAPYPVMVEGADGDVTPVVQAYAYGKFLGEVTVTFDEAGAVVSATGEPILIDASVTPDPEIAARVAALGAPIEAMKAEVIGETAAPIDGERTSCRAGECAMGVLVTDAMLWASDAEIAIQNGGGLRASIDAGPVTMGEVLTVLPFQNTLATFSLKGSDVIAALENGLSQVEEGAGRFPQVGGMRYRWDPSAPAGSRVASVEVAEGDGWAPLDPMRVYRVVSNNFMRAGGDGYSMFRDAGMDAYDYGPGLEEATARYIAETSPYEPRTEGRVDIVQNQ